MGEEDLRELLRGCLTQDRRSQKMLYKAFYCFAMSICLRYTGNRDEAADAMNQGFMKVFTKIESFDTSRPFKAWLGRIMMNVSIDHYRASLKMAYSDDLENAEHLDDGTITDGNLNYQDLLAMVQQLPQSYRTVFNLFAIDGYSHEEIADMLNINVGTSKSNLFKARQRLKQMIVAANGAANVDYDKGINFTSVVAINGSPIDPVYYNNGTRE
jgi:RNA polymerase sigma factor (sigma-70 family)